ncbi:hypothetical protein BaRGS_00036568 [Batillaria attramentaria]|uniref:MAD2L1-binding protein n=1 Tax=Batillaria attramentaria TaxID=370345 RepID=A0ABD0JB49_9CAEN
MAGCSKQFEFVFDGGLQSSTRALLVNEVIKHLLYERNQIPLQFDFLRQQLALAETDNAQQPSTKPLSSQSQVDRKAKSVISNLDNMFENIIKAFETCPEIQKAVVLLGSTPATPKESYIINLPHLCPEADNISLKSSKQALFQHLVAEQVLSSDLPLGPTNLYVVLCAPRTASHLPGFIPKASFKVPSRGHCLTLNMLCRQPTFACQDLTFEDTEVEISGIEPLSLECSSLDATVAYHVMSPSPEKRARLQSQFHLDKRKRHLSNPDKDFDLTKIHFSTPLIGSTPKISASNQPLGSLDLYNGTNCGQSHSQSVWFQCSTVVKGYRV